MRNLLVAANLVFLPLLLASSLALCETIAKHKLVFGLDGINIKAGSEVITVSYSNPNHSPQNYVSCQMHISPSPFERPISKGTEFIIQNIGKPELNGGSYQTRLVVASAQMKQYFVICNSNLKRSTMELLSDIADGGLFSVVPEGI